MTFEGGLSSGRWAILWNVRRLRQGTLDPLRDLAVIALIWVPAMWLSWRLVVLGQPNFSDMTGALWAPGHLIREGINPYPSPLSDLSGTPSVYPPLLILIAGVPLSLLPLNIAAALWASCMLVASGLSLWVVGVRDKRCYIVALCSVPFLAAILGANATPLVVLLVAVAWRYRDRAWTPGLAIAAAIAIKPFIVPLLVWLVVTRRWRALFAAVAGSAGLVLASWAVIGFKGLSEYPSLLMHLSRAAGPHGSSVYALLAAAGGGANLSQAIALTCAAAALIYGRGSFQSAILASLLATPVIWAHYFALLYVVAAISSPQLSRRWLAPLALAPTVFFVSHTRPVFVTALGIAAAVAVCAPRLNAAPPAATSGETGRRSGLLGSRSYAGGAG